MRSITRLVMCVLLVIVTGQELSDEEYSRMPQVAHLDDFERCLAGGRGVYCLGSFRLAPRPDLPVYSLIEEYSKKPEHFNRSHVQRGLCLNSRCPLDSERGKRSESYRNETWRFEQCVEQWAQSQGFSSTPDSIEYCRTSKQAKARQYIKLDSSMVVFLVVAFSTLFANVVGTAYDLMTSGSEKKNKFLEAWSMKKNWERLTAHHHDGDPQRTALTPLQGVRVFIMIFVIAMHCGLFYHTLYTQNTRSLENMMKLPIMIMARNGTALVQVFVVVSTFLLAYHLLLHSKSHEVGFRLLPKIWLARAIRLSPLHLMAVGFAATWWPALADGPMWYAVEREAEACRRKFWTHALYLHNLVDPDDQCLLQTWFLAVDMQLFILSSVLTLMLVRWRGKALLILGALITAASAINGVLAYCHDWTTMLYIMKAENCRTMFKEVPSFKWYYAAPWGSLPAALIGIFLAFLHFHLQEKGFKSAEHKWLVCLYHCTIPVTIGFVLMGIFTEHVTSRLFSAVYVALERPIFSILCTICIFGMINNFNGFVKKFYGWRGFHALGRMTLAALLMHWILGLSLLAATPGPLIHSNFRFFCDYVATVVLTYVASVPLTIMVEMPFQRMFAAIFA